jgi:hypothetical protein
MQKYQLFLHLSFIHIIDYKDRYSFSSHILVYKYNPEHQNTYPMVH